MISAIEEWLKNSAQHLPLELSSFVGGLVEEVIAPIPSPFVMAAVGSAAFAQDRNFISLVLLAIVGSAGKTLGAWFIYYVVDKVEDFVMGKFGKFLGISHKEVEALGKHFDGKKNEGWILFLLRALPIVPSSPISALCGLIKTNLRTYLLATFGGNIIRNLIYIYLGFSGVSAYQSFLSGMDNTESIIQVGIFICFLALVGWFYYKRSQKKRSNSN